MKGKWMRKMAVIMSLCLFLNSGFLDLAGYVYAAAGDSVPSSTSETTNTGDTDTSKESDNSGTTSSSTSESDTRNTTTGDGADSSSNSDAATGDGTDSSSNSGTTTGDGTGSSSNGDAATGDGTDSSSGSGTTTGDGTGNTTPDGSTGTPTTGDGTGDTTTDTTTDENANDTVSENTIEGQEGAGDIYAVSLLSEEGDDTSSADSNRLPDSLDDYLEQLKEGTAKDTYYIQDWADFIKVQEFCNSGSVNGFNGVTFIITMPASGLSDDAKLGIWNTAEMKANLTINEEDGASDYTFTGIGTSSAPFKGAMYCIMDSGVSFKLDKPLFAYLGDDANIYKLQIEANGCCSPIAANISGAVTLSDLTISGTIGTGGNLIEGEAGTLAGKIESGASITVTNVTSTANVAATVAGGLAGIIGKNVTITIPEDSSVIGNGTPISVTGTYAAGGFFGKVLGDYTIDLSWMDNEVLSNVIGNGAFAGQLAGIVDNYAKLTLENGSSVKVSVGVPGSGYSATAGGLVGACYNYSSVILPSEEGEFTIDGTVSAGNGTAGGVFGEVKNCRMELDNITVTASVSGSVVGGIIGYVAESVTRLIIDTPTVNGTLETTSDVGGILGKIDRASAVELQGIVTVAGTLSGSRVGSIAAKQYRSLIYLHEIQGKNSDGTLQLNVPMGDDSLPKYDEVYENGGVFRNQDMGTTASGTQKFLIGDGTLDNVGVINNTITGGNLGEDGQTDAAADLETFAIANFTEGEYGLKAFGESATLEQILADDYILCSNADISYDTTGIITLNCNFTSDVNRAFSGSLSGSLSGTNAAITITQNSNVMQEAQQGKLGLFSSMAGNPSFSNLIIEGMVTRSANVGGLAYCIVDNGNTSGTSLTLNNIQIKKVFENINTGIGGILVKEDANSLFTVTATNVTLASTINAGSLANFSGFITNMENAEVNLDMITIGGEIVAESTLSSASVGGFLGKEWTQTGGTIQKVTVQNGTSYKTRSKFGCLINKVSNRAEGSKLTLDTVSMSNLTVTMWLQADCALLIQNGSDLVLEVIDYSAVGAKVNYAGADFDEIMAYNVIDADQKTFGVVSLHQSGSRFPTYHYERQATYSNGTTTPINKDSRYYYDLFQLIDTETTDENGSTVTTPAVTISKNGDYYVIDSALKYYLWDVVQCCGSNTNVIKTFEQYFPDGIPTNTKQKYYFKGDLDLSRYSVYPIPRQQQCEYVGLDNATITFAADDMKGWQLSNVANSQHYMLHSGMFYNTYGELTVKDLTLAGSIASVDSDHCGALVAGTLNGGGTFENITLDNLNITDYSGNGSSLLIANIPSGTAVFNGIKMISYAEKDYETTKAGAALIHSAGGENETELVIKFTSMIIPYDKETSTSYGEILQYASFLYRYDYTDDASINKGSGLYLFTEEDATGTPKNVTYGAELDNDTEFCDTTAKVLETTGINPADCIPYVYQEKQIEVNPKSGDILKGCGTYEDPYIIENTKQFLTLYRYINEPVKADGEDYQYQTFYEGWKVVKMGDDSEFCDTKHRVSLADDSTAEDAIVTASDGTQLTGDGAEDVKVFGQKDDQDDFPTPDELSQAYYQLGADIDLSGITNSTYKTIAKDFVGFGTLERPFIGVWYGIDAKDRKTMHTITLPDKPSDAKYTTYGFIQYAKGVVVKDLNLTTTHSKVEAEGGTVDQSTMAKIKTDVNDNIDCSGGSVIACILGGDNIIDNVTTSVYLRSYADSAIGGYVGRVQKGGLILRNITEDSFKNFRLYITATNMPGTYCGSIAGKVEDGYIIYEGTSDGYTYEPSVAVKECNGLLTVDAVPNYSILTAGKLQNANITVVKDSTDSNITINIPNAEALQVMSMAMNADALNICPSDYQSYVQADNQHWGYSETSRSRKAEYSKIGNCLETYSDYLSAAMYDNVMGYESEDKTYTSQKAYGYPYLYKYMGITGDQYLAYMDGEYSILNPGETINETNYHLYWELTDAAEYPEYDMSVFKNGFRGIGALYRTGDGYGATFRGNFEGNNRSIILDINRRTPSKEVEQFPSSKRAGLFNGLYAPVAANTTAQGIYNDTADFSVTIPCYTIQNFAIGGMITGIGHDTTYKTQAACSRVYAGGVVGEIAQGNFIFDNISTVKDNPLTITSKSTNGTSDAQYAAINDFGGIVGRIGTTNSYIWIKNCNWSADEISLNGYDHGGGLVGRSTAKILMIESCSMENLNLFSSYENAGGLIGHVDESSTYLMLIGTESPVSVKNSSVTGSWQAAGLVGESRCNTFAENLYSEANILSSRKSMGGVIGELANLKESSLEKVTVKNIVINESSEALIGQSLTGMGGVIGASTHTLLLANVQVTGEIDKNTDAYKCSITGPEKSRDANLGVGGIIGSQTTKVATLQGCNVTNVSLSGKAKYKNDSVFVAVGGLIGYNGVAVYLKDYTDADKNQTSGLKIVTQLKSESDVVVLAAGGCFGLIRGKVYAGTDSSSGYYIGLSAENNTVQGKYAGGLVGRLDTASNQIGSLRLQAVQVKGGTVFSDEAAGGLIGYAQSNSGGFAFNDSGESEDTQTNLISDMTITGRAAGGAYGYVVDKMDIRTENIKVMDSEIVGKIDSGLADDGTMVCSAGGFVGEIAFKVRKPFNIYEGVLSGNIIVCETTSSTIGKPEKYAVGGILGRTVSASGEGELLCDNINIDVYNRIGVRVADDTSSDEVKLVKAVYAEDGTISSYELSASTELPDADELVSEEEESEETEDSATGESESAKNYDALESLVQEYGYCVGTIIGSMDSNKTQVYMTRTSDSNNEFVIPVMKYNPPVTDVGRNADTQIDESSDDYYRKNAHIIYGAPVTEKDSYMAGAKNLAYMKERVEAVGNVYPETGITLNELLGNYRLSEEAVELFEDAYETSYTFPGSGHTTGPILVYKPEYGTLQEFLECMTDIMTNVAGASASDVGYWAADYKTSRLQISCKQKVVTGTTVTDGTDAASVSATFTSDAQVVYSSPVYDGLINDGASMTYTEITYTYYHNDSRKKVFVLPVYVEEPILYGVHMKVMEGSVTSVDEIKENGILANDTIQIANDSDYTLLMEYTYGKAREKMPDDVITEKTFYLQENGVAKTLPVGTKLRLIDVTHGNKAYYYEVKTEGIDKLTFAQFTDSAGEPYENQPIVDLDTETDADQTYYSDLAASSQTTEEDKAVHQLTDTGVERYLLTVMNENEGKQMYTIHTDLQPQMKNGTEKDHADAASQFAALEGHEEMPYFTVVAIPGLSIKLDSTKVSGEISKESSLTINTTFSLTADQLYWQLGDETGLDSENAGKYLELAFYLRDGTTRVNLPNGTNFSYVIKTEDGTEIYSENKVIQDNSLVYYYKDIRDLFGEDAEYQIGNLTENTSVSVEFNLNFANADMADFANGDYTAYIELLRTADKDYPMGSGNSMDIDTITVTARVSNNLGFAVRAVDVNELAINTYPSANETDTIQYQTLFDFSDILERISGEGKEQALNKWAEFNYEVTYTLYKKTENGATVTYEPYAGDDIIIEVPSAAAESGVVTSVNGKVTTVYNFTDQEIEDGNDGQAGLLIKDGKMTIKTSNLVAADENLTNYKIVASLKIREKESTDTDEESGDTDDETTTEDFFVFTVTKLKTDLSQ